MKYPKLSRCSFQLAPALVDETMVECQRKNGHLGDCKAVWHGIRIRWGTSPKLERKIRAEHVREVLDNLPPIGTVTRDDLLESVREDTTYAMRLASLREAHGKIRQIILSVENRCLASDGDVTPTLQEMTEAELRQIWQIADRAFNTNHEHGV